MLYNLGLCDRNSDRASCCTVPAVPFTHALCSPRRSFRLPLKGARKEGRKSLMLKRSCVWSKMNGAGQAKINVLAKKSLQCCFLESIFYLKKNIFVQTLSWEELDKAPIAIPLCVRACTCFAAGGNLSVYWQQTNLQMLKMFSKSYWATCLNPYHTRIWLEYLKVWITTSSDVQLQITSLQLMCQCTVEKVLECQWEIFPDVGCAVGWCIDLVVQ